MSDNFYFLCSIIHNVFVVTTITNIRLLEKLIVMHRAVGTNNKCVVGRGDCQFMELVS
jgi:hypothetical protein